MPVNATTWPRYIKCISERSVSEVTRTKEFRITSIAFVVIGISGLMWVVPPADVEVANSLHHLNFMPVLLSAVLLGWRGAAFTTVATGIAQSPYILISQRVSPENALDQVVELSI